jgi:outer membrane immunogenic protein
MKKILIVGSALAALIGMPAFAADMPVKAPAPAAAAPTWTGFYAGFNVGGAWSSSTMSDVVTGDVVPNDPVSFGSPHNLGAVGGFQGGYNWQFSPLWVAGVEGDFDFASLGNFQSAPRTSFGVPIGGGNFQSMSDNLNWLASARAKLGYVWGSTLWYATGGAAWDNSEYNGLAHFASGQFANANFTNTKSGWVAGGGVEFMATEHVLLRLEYLYYAFAQGQTASVACGNPAPCGPAALAGNFSWSNANIQAVRAALSYKF